MNIDRVNAGPNAHPPRLEAVPGTRRADDAEEEPGDRAAIGDGERPDVDVVRSAKVAEARIKILNDYYSRRDIQRELAERLILELGA